MAALRHCRLWQARSAEWGAGGEGQRLAGPSPLGVSGRARATQVDLSTRADVHVFTRTCVLPLRTERSWDNDKYIVYTETGRQTGQVATAVETEPRSVCDVPAKVL